MKEREETIARKGKSKSEKSGGGHAVVSGPCYADQPDVWQPSVTVTIERLTHGRPLPVTAGSCLLHDAQATHTTKWKNAQL